MSPPREIELKLDVPADSLRRLAGSSLLKGVARSPFTPASLVSVYFDTDKLKLRKKGLSLRVRQIGQRRVQTIKHEDSARAGLFDRSEWEHEISADQPDLDAARNTALGPLRNGRLRRGPKTRV